MRLQAVYNPKPLADDFGILGERHAVANRGSPIVATHDHYPPFKRSRAFAVVAGEFGICRPNALYFDPSGFDDAARDAVAIK